jgi:hypothetical protein
MNDVDAAKMRRDEKRIANGLANPDYSPEARRIRKAEQCEYERY